MVTGENKTESRSERNSPLAEYSSSILSIDIGDKTVKFGVFEIDSEVVTILDEIPVNQSSSSIYFQERNEFNKVIIIQSDAGYKLDPKALSKKSTVFSVQNEIPAINGLLSFSESENVISLKQIFPGAEVKHFMSDFIEGIIHRTRFLKGVRLYAHIEAELIHVVSVANGKLLSAVTESIEDNSDMIYHLLSRVELNEFNQLDDTLILSGNIEIGVESYKILKNYIKDVQLNKGFRYQKVNSDYSNVPKQKFFSIINSFQCV